MNTAILKLNFPNVDFSCLPDFTKKEIKNIKNLIFNKFNNINNFCKNNKNIIYIIAFLILKKAIDISDKFYFVEKTYEMSNISIFEYIIFLFNNNQIDKALTLFNNNNKQLDKVLSLFKNNNIIKYKNEYNNLLEFLEYYKNSNLTNNNTLFKIAKIYESIYKYNISKEIYLIIISNHFENKLDFEFNTSSVYNNLALMYYYLNEYNNSLTYYIKAINLNDNISLENVKKDYFNKEEQLYLFLKNFCNSKIANNFVSCFENTNKNIFLCKLYDLKINYLYKIDDCNICLDTDKKLIVFNCFKHYCCINCCIELYNKSCPFCRYTDNDYEYLYNIARSMFNSLDN